MPSLARIIQLGKILNCAYTPNADGSYTLPDGYEVAATIFGDDLATLHKACAGIPSKTVQYGFVARKGNDFVVAVRGTTTGFEWAEDGDFIKQKSPFGIGYVEDGFGDVYGSLACPVPEIPSATQSLAECICEAVSRKPGATLTLTGHSLGGPLVTQAGQAVAHLNPAVVTFASPFTGDSAFAAAYNQLVPNTTRIVNAKDIVPKLPFLGYAHVNTLMSIDSGGDMWDWRYRHSLDTYLSALTAMSATSAA